MKRKDEITQRFSRCETVLELYRLPAFLNTNSRKRLSYTDVVQSLEVISMNFCYSVRLEDIVNEILNPGQAVLLNYSMAILIVLL